MSLTEIFRRSFLSLVTITFIGCESTRIEIPPRTTGVMVGPDLVFSQPLAELLPELEGARATQDNGRVGNELVFWSYDLSNGDPVYFFGCGIFEEVDCQSRIPSICPDRRGALLRSAVSPGQVRHLECRPVANAGIGDVLPNCSDQEINEDILIGLVSCP